ncbi:MAG TPA: hypothetical protein VF092_04095 [Longimicrobium sp.]
MTQPNQEHATELDAMRLEAGVTPLAAGTVTPCDEFGERVDEVIRRDCRRKVNHLRHCSGEQERCPWQIRPRGPICFGDIEPCRDNRGSCVSREVVLITRGAKGGDYRVIVGPVCFSVCWGYATRDCFVLPLCPD